MLQKFLRITALFFLIALILSPIYFKHIRHYVSAMPFTMQEIENITPKIVVETDKKAYGCQSNHTIQFPLKSSGIQVLHFTSPLCKACIDDSHIWNSLPGAIHNAINGRNTTQEVQIVNILKESVLASQTSLEFGRRLIFNEDPIIRQKLLDLNISVCIGAIKDSEMGKIGVDVIPATFIIKKGRVIYSISEPTSASEITRIAEIVAQNIG